MSIIKTQGLHIWVADKNKGLHKVCPTSLGLGDVDYEEIDVTTLCEENMKQTVKGLMNEGETTFGVNLDPSNAAHMALYELAQDKNDPVSTFIVGLAKDSDVSGYDAKAAPTYEDSTDTVTLPNTRHWLKFTGSVAKFPFDVEGNSVMKVTVAVKQKTPISFIKAS